MMRAPTLRRGYGGRRPRSARQWQRDRPPGMLSHGPRRRDPAPVAICGWRRASAPSQFLRRFFFLLGKAGDAAGRREQFFEMRLPARGALMLLRTVEQFVEQHRAALGVALLVLDHMGEDAQR